MMVGELVAEHEGELFIEELVLTGDLFGIVVLCGWDEVGVWARKRGLGFDAGGNELRVALQAIATKDFVGGFGASGEGHDFEEAVADGHQRLALIVAGGEGVYLADRGIGKERDGLNF